MNDLCTCRIIERAKIGYSRITCQRKVLTGFQKVQTRLVEGGMLDPISYDIFGRATQKSQQLFEWAVAAPNVSRPLHCYPEAFMEIQARALCNNNERRTELEHFQVQQSGKRGTKYTCHLLQ